jgi:hypothetical protein
VFRLFVKKPPDPVSDAVADHAAQSSGEKDFEKTVPAEKSAVRHRARHQERDVALDRAERENRVDAVVGDELRKVFHIKKTVNRRFGGLEKE